MKAIINTCYVKSINNKDIIKYFGFIAFTIEFKYLGSVISHDLDDCSKICLRIKQLIKLWEL